MQLNPTEQKDGVRWFWGSLVFALVLSSLINRFDCTRPTTIKRSAIAPC